MITNVIFLDVVATRQECPFWPTDDCIQGRKKIRKYEVSFKNTLSYSFVFFEQTYFYVVCLMKITSMFLMFKICQRCHLGYCQQIA